MTGTAKPLNLSQPFLVSALIAEIAKQSPHTNVNNAQFAAIVDAVNHVVAAFNRDSGDA
ncbi:hypothetical protein [Pantoea anthophila]|uniref:hypothetical protein n=1 Tax=Pantoea anthophila TaxID=470931 RepID=UPI000AD76D18|nr:hypothetical protein [Pantoea anthophila]